MILPTKRFFGLCFLALLGASGVAVVENKPVLELAVARKMITPYRTSDLNQYNFYHVKPVRFEAVGEGGVNIKAIFVPSTTGTSKGTVLILHGLHGCKDHMVWLADYLSKRGFNCIAYDSRAHGESGGEFCTFGYLEKNDVSHVIDAALSRFGNIAPFGIVGVSMGAAVALQSLPIEHRLSCAVVCCPFARLGEMAERQLGTLSKLGLASSRGRIIHDAENLSGFTVSEVSPLEAATRVQVPVLVIHGDHDRGIPYTDGKSIYDNIPAAGKKWFLAKGAGHDDILKMDASWGKEVYANLAELLNAHMAKRFELSSAK